MLSSSQHDDEDDHHFGDHDEYGLDDEDHVEMRARPSSVSASGYVQVNTEEEDFDDGHRPGHHRRRNNQNTRIETRLQRLRKLIPKEPPKGCKHLKFALFDAFHEIKNAPQSNDFIQVQSAVLSSVVQG